MGIWGKVLLGEERRWESGRNSGGVGVDVESGEACEELRRSLLLPGMEFSSLPFPILESVSCVPLNLEYYSFDSDLDSDSLLCCLCR